jgi:hypothetical protein
MMKREILASRPHAAVSFAPRDFHAAAVAEADESPTTTPVGAGVAKVERVESGVARVRDHVIKHSLGESELAPMVSDFVFELSDCHCRNAAHIGRDSERSLGKLEILQSVRYLVFKLSDKGRTWVSVTIHDQLHTSDLRHRTGAGVC